MISFPDTSFLCAIYRQQVTSPAAAACFQALPEPLAISTLLLFEFRQSVRFQTGLNALDPKKGFSVNDSAKMLADLRGDLSTGVVEIAPVDWPSVHHVAERLSAQHTSARLHRSLDILHVATALCLGAKAFLTFDTNQKRLAQAEGLKLPL